MSDMNASPRRKGRRVLTRSALLLAYVLLAAAMFYFGKNHTVLLDNQDASDGTAAASGSVRVSVDGGEPIELARGDREMLQLRSQWHKVEIATDAGRRLCTFRLPLGQDIILLSIPRLQSGRGQAVVPFVPQAAEPAN